LQGLLAAINGGSRASFLAAALVALLAVIATAAPLRGAATGEPTVLRPDRFVPIAVGSPGMVVHDNASYIQLMQPLNANLIGTPADQVPPQRLAFPSVAAAEQEMKRKARVPSALPPQLTGDPEVVLFTANSASYVLDLPKMQQLMAGAGLPDVQLPTTLHGARVNVDVPAALTMRWGTGREALGFVQLRQPKVTVPAEVELPAVRELLLNHPRIEGLSPEIIAELRGIEQWQTTVPIPVPTGAEAQPVRVDGSDGVVITSILHEGGLHEGGLHEGSALVWQRNGSVYALTGPYEALELLAVAESLR